MHTNKRKEEEKIRTNTALKICMRVWDAFHLGLMMRKFKIYNLDVNYKFKERPIPQICICKSAERIVVAQVKEQLVGNKNSRRKMKFAVVYLCCKLKRSFLVINLYLHTHICIMLSLSYALSAVHDAIPFKSLEKYRIKKKFLSENFFNNLVKSWCKFFSYRRYY